MNGLSRAALRALTLGALLAIAGSSVAQQAYPNRTVRLIVPYVPGGAVDPQARLIATRLSERFKQQVIVDNRGGGNTVIGTDVVAKSAPDGYTLLWVAPAFVTTPSLLKQLPYDNIKDFEPVATVSRTRMVLVLNTAVPANNLKELIALAKAKPGQLNYASSGVGTGPHLAGELFNIEAGVKTQHIPYKGSGQLVPDLIAGEVQMSFQGVVTVISHIKNGRLKAIVVGGETRVPALPQVPTFAEAGLPGYDRKDSWHGIVAPAGTPKVIVEKLSTEIRRIVAAPDIQAQLANQGLDPFISNPGETAALIKADIARIGAIIKTANIQLENQ